MTTSYQNCVFSLPVRLYNGEDFDDYEYSKMTCVSTSTSDIFNASSSASLIKNEVTGAEFYLDKTLNYGDAVIIWFLTIFSVYMIFKVVYNFFWKK